MVVPDRFRGHDHAAMALGLRDELAELGHVVVVGDPGDALDFGRLIDDAWDDLPGLDAELERRRPGPDDLVEIQFTSGTTGEPKGVLHSHNTVYSGGRAIGEVYGLGRDDVCFMASTLAHQTGFGYGMLVPLSLGMTVVYQDLWDADQMLDAVEAEGISWTVSATAFAMDMVAAQRRRARDLASFRYFVCGGAPIPPKVVEEAADVLGAELIAVWGMTENMIVTTTRPGDPVELVSDSDGTPVDWMEIRVVDGGRPVEVGASGDLQTRGPSQSLGYFDREDLYRAAAPDGDWFDTGDVARLRADGGIRIVGRTKDLVIRGGENVPVAEVEALLLRHRSRDRGGRHRHPRRSSGGTGVRRGHRHRSRPHAGRPHERARRGRDGEAVLAGAAGARGRDAPHALRQDPEVQAPGAARADDLTDHQPSSARL